MPQHTLILGNRFTYINPPFSNRLSSLVEEEFSIENEDGSEAWRGYDRKSSTIYTGLVHGLRQFASKHGVSLSIQDSREKPTDVRPFETNFTLRDYQEEAIERLTSVGRGLASIATGAGKTVLNLEAFARIGVSGVVIVPTQVIWVQFIKTALLMFAKNIEDVPDLRGATFRELTELIDTIELKCPIGYIGQGEWKPDRITIAISAALDGSKRSRNYLESVDMFISDECHHSAASSWFASLMRSNAYYRFGVSGTTYRTDGQELKLYATAGPIIHTIRTSFMIDEGWLAQPIIRMVRCKSPRIGTPKKWANYYRSNVLYCNERTRITLSLIGNSIERDIKTLVLVAWDEHARSLLSRMSTATRSYVEYVKADHGRTKIKEAIQRFANGEVRVLMATPLLSEGYDLCSLDRLIRASAMRSPIRVTQETGRVLRIEGAPKNGITTEVWDFYDIDHSSLSKHSEARLDTWRQEEAFDVQVVDDWAQPSFQGLVERTGYLDVREELGYSGHEPSDRVMDF